MPEATVTRKELIEKLNEDLSREYQAIIAYVVYSQVLKGAEYMNIAKELEKHAGERCQGVIDATPIRHGLRRIVRHHAIDGSGRAL